MHKSYMGEWEVVTAATVNTKGMNRRECTICGEQQVESIRPTGPSDIFSTYDEITWDTISEMAGQISEDDEIIAETTEMVSDVVTEVTKTVDNKTYTLKLGDYVIIPYGNSETKIDKKARIIGFKHDILATGTEYGKTGDVYAGISFEFVNTLEPDSKINESNTNEGGWNSCTLRLKLNSENGEYLSKLPEELKKEIKPVKKKWNLGNNISAKNQPNDTIDKLWILSVREVRTLDLRLTQPEGVTYGFYQKNADASKGWKKYTASTSSTTQAYWWTRTPSVYSTVQYYYMTNSTDNTNADTICGVAPGFSI